MSVRVLCACVPTSDSQDVCLNRVAFPDVFGDVVDVEFSTFRNSCGLCSKKSGFKCSAISGNFWQRLNGNTADTRCSMLIAPVVIILLVPEADTGWLRRHDTSCAQVVVKSSGLGGRIDLKDD